MNTERRSIVGDIPHMQGDKLIREYNRFGFPVSDTVAPCGRRVAVTLTTRDPARVRCEKCRKALEQRPA